MEQDHLTFRPPDESEQLRLQRHQEWKLLHPIRITLSKLLVCGGGLALHSVAPVAGTLLYSAGHLCDVADGKVARRFGLTTREGEILDPMVDKMVEVMSYAYILAQLPVLEMASLQSVALMMLVSSGLALRSQMRPERGPIGDQVRRCLQVVKDPASAELVDKRGEAAAGMAGKFKVWAQAIAIVTLLLADDFPGVDAPQVYQGANVVMALSLVLAFASIKKGPSRREGPPESRS